MSNERGTPETIIHNRNKQLIKDVVILTKLN